MTGLGLPRLATVTIGDGDGEEGVIVAVVIGRGQGGELLVSRHEWGGNVMGEQVGLGSVMTQLNDILVANNTAASSLGKSLGGKDLPMVVDVFVGIASDLLT